MISRFRKDKAKSATTTGEHSSARHRLKYSILTAITVGVVFTIVIQTALRIHKAGKTELNQYEFKITRNLVKTVEHAKKLLEQKGLDCLPELDEMKSSEFDLYLYVYRLSDAKCLYHGENQDFAGKQLDAFVDQYGKQLNKLIAAELENPFNQHAWVHYYWNRPQNLFMEWKSSCNFKFTLPDGDVCYVGGGVYGIGAETEFARIAVASADQLLRTEGERALPELVKPSGPFFLHDTSIFLLHEDGQSIIDPVVKKRFERNVLEYNDAVGHQPFKHLMRALETKDEAQIVLYARVPFSMNTQKKTMYARRSMMDGQPVIVGIIIDAPRSVWQR